MCDSSGSLGVLLELPEAHLNVTSYIEGDVIPRPHSIGSVNSALGRWRGDSQHHMGYQALEN
ncbi:unnamed protein product [Brassica oleracea var. botrytis]|uniref:Uncharacterized protein n=2 Tax=Brassica TaxID=3705 RepID=A0A3P6FXX7_BRAOL|nr:unnamed protein product [Brassica napus]VDD47159.1 unnamed protein product [Brassica oleracea]